MSFFSFTIVFSFFSGLFFARSLLLLLLLLLMFCSFHMHHISLVSLLIYPSIRLHILFIFNNLCAAKWIVFSIFLPSFSPLVPFTCYCLLKLSSDILCVCVWVGESGLATRQQQRMNACVYCDVCSAFVAYNQSFLNEKKNIERLLCVSLVGCVRKCESILVQCTPMYINNTKLATINHFLPGRTENWKYEFNFAIEHKQFQWHQQCIGSSHIHIFSVFVRRM